MAEKPKREIAFMKIVITADVYAKLADFKAKWKSEGEKAADVLIRVETGNGQAHEQEFSMSEFLDAIGFEEANEAIKPCEICGGSGELEIPAENRGGSIVGPDIRPCTGCSPYPQHDEGNE